MTKEVDEFLEGLNEDGQADTFENKAGDPFPEDKSDEKGQPAEKEEKLPFHKDPKVQRFIEKELDKRMKDMSPRETEKFVKELDGTDDITDVLTRIIGNDTPEKSQAIKDFKKILLDREERGAQKALESIQERERAERDEEIEAQEELEQGFEAIEESYGVDLMSNTPQAKKTRSEFIDFIVRVAPKDENGEVSEYPDFEETFKLFQDVKKSTAPANRAKDLASRGMNRSSETPAAPLKEDLSFKNADKIFDRLFGNK